MLPPQASEKTESQAERRLFRKIRDELSDEWAAVHSLGLTSHRVKPWAEIDFVLVGPDGVYCLEVKGGRVARVDGEWLFTNRKDETTRKHEGPFAQVGSASAALHRQIREHVPTAKHAKVAYGVVTPDIVFDIEGPDVEPQVVYDERDLGSPFEDYVGRLVAYWRARLDGDGPKTRPLTPAQRSAVVDYLRGDFDRRPSLRAQIGLVNEELLRLTVEQYAVLDGLVDNPRVVVRGSAGSGKTLLAVEEARRQADKGRRVLLCCFNRQLGRFLARSVGDQPAIEARTVHSLMAGLVREAGWEERLPDASEGDLYALLYPELALEALLESEPRFDTLIVDEGQDVLRPAYLDVLDAALVGGLAEGEWRVFLDPKQNMFEGTDLSALTDLLRHEPAQYRLRLNCRNTAAIATDTAILSATECDEVLRAEGPEVEHVWYRDRNHQRRLVTNHVNRLLSEGLPPEDVVVLGRRRLENSSLAEKLGALAAPLVDASEGESADKGVRYCTVGSFKGMEADVVLLVDVDDLRSAEARQSLYVGLSRSRALLAVFLAETVRADYEELASDFGERLTASGSTPVSQP